MATHRAVHVASAGGALELVHVETVPPGPGHVRMDVAACGVCGTDHAFVNGVFPGLSWPVTPGHEIAGTVAEVGPGVEGVEVGERVVVGWFGGNCGHCARCRAGQLIHCLNGQIPSWHYPGGYAESVVVPATALARIPDELSFVEAAPMSCAGVTTYNALRRARAVPGDRVAVIGIGGLGHLALQFLNKWGCDVTAFTSSASKADEARAMGAHHIVDTHSKDGLAAVAGTFDFIISTVNANLDWDGYIGALAPKGHLHIVGVPPAPIPVSGFALLVAQRSVGGSPSGAPATVATMLEFCARHGIKPVTEQFAMSQANEAFAHLEAGKARYRIVLKNDL